MSEILLAKKIAVFSFFLEKTYFFNKKNYIFRYSEKNILFFIFLIVSSERKFYKLSNDIIKKAQQLLLTFLSAKNLGWNAIQKMHRGQTIQKNYNSKTSFPLNGLYIGELDPLIYFFPPDWYLVRSENLRFSASGDLCPTDPVSRRFFFSPGDWRGL